MGVHPPPAPARANFTLITECTPESSGCNSVNSEMGNVEVKIALLSIKYTHILLENLSRPEQHMSLYINVPPLNI